MQCLLCSDEAVNITPCDYDGCGIRCPTCGEYLVAGSAWAQFHAASLDERRRAFQRASWVSGKLRRPTILVADLIDVPNRLLR